MIFQILLAYLFVRVEFVMKTLSVIFRKSRLGENIAVVLWIYSCNKAVYLRANFVSQETNCIN